MLRPGFDRERLTLFCHKWKITELSVFGSALRDDFGPDSDVDLLATFAPEARWSLLDLAEMQEELAGVFGREVDLVAREAVEGSENYLRRRRVLDSLETLYVAR